MPQPQQALVLDVQLAQAVDRGLAADVRSLIASGASIHQVDKYDNTLLHKAAQMDRVAVARILLEAGVPVDARSFYGNTPLHGAVVRGGATVGVLLEHGAQIEARNNDGYTPLLQAAACNQIATVEQLLGAGADINARTVRGDSAFDLAAIQSNDAMALWLLKHYPHLAPTGERLNDTLAKAVRDNHPKLVIKLAELGADLAHKLNGRTLIQLVPREAPDLKRLIHSLRTGAAVGAAMNDAQGPVADRADHSAPTL